MVVKFGKDYLEQLYYTETCKDKRYRFQSNIVRGYIRRIQYLSQANRIEDLYRFHGLHYEVLVGDKKGISSIRINDQYRIEFTVEIVEGETVVTLCTILDITNHYK